MAIVDVAIVGGGLFGSIIASALARKGRTVRIFDDTRSEAGSTPAACLMKPSWFMSLGKGVYEPALSQLSELYEVREITFRVGQIMSSQIMWIDPQTILGRKTTNATVKQIVSNGKGWKLSAGNELIEARMVVVAAGIWTQLLVPSVKQKPMAGMAFLWPKASIEVPFVKLWAPFKQVVGFNRGDGLWVGDGSAILRQNWTDAHTERSLDRCTTELRRTSWKPAKPVQLFGIRPYHEAKPCFLKEVRPKFWVATGGAKNGTLAAGWCAHEIVRQS